MSIYNILYLLIIVSRIDRKMRFVFSMLILQMSFVLGFSISNILPFLQGDNPMQNESLDEMSDEQLFNLLFRKELLSENSDVFSYREKNFMTNAEKVNKHNKNADKSYRMRTNSLSFLSSEEFDQMYLSLIPSTEESLEWANTIIEKSRSQTQEGHARLLQESQKQNIEPPQGLRKLMLSYLLHKGIDEKEANSTFDHYCLKQPIHQRQTSLKEPSIIVTPDEDNPSDEDSPFSSPVFLKQDKYKNLNNSVVDPIKTPIDWSCIAGNAFDQGRCGSCYAVAASDAYSMIMGIYLYKVFYRMSTQEILDCARNGLTLGCSGGLLEGAYIYMYMHGLNSHIDYPYSQKTYSDAKVNQCDLSKQKLEKKWRIESFRRLVPDSCIEMIYELRKHPFSVGIAINSKFREYNRGVFDECDPETPMNHAVVLIGYNVEGGWKIKNSWGADWGQNGFGWIKNGNTCKICDLAVIATPFNKQVQDNIIYKDKKVHCKAQ